MTTNSTNLTTSNSKNNNFPVNEPISTNDSTGFIIKNILGVNTDLQVNDVSDLLEKINIVNYI